MCHPRNERGLRSKPENWINGKGLWLPQCLIAETAMYRFKQIITPKLSLRSYNSLEGEILVGVKVMNKVIGLGMPIQQAVN